MKYKTGDKPGAGRYRCDNCGYVVRITSDAEALPACPNCGHHEFTKLEDLSLIHISALDGCDAIVRAGDCMACGAGVAACPTHALAFGLGRGGKAPAAARPESGPAEA